MERVNKNTPKEKKELSGRETSRQKKEIKPDMEQLTLYKHLKLALADQLRIIIQGLAALGREKGEKQCRNLMVKLAEDRFTLAVLGQFKRGKSSLMKAIIGRKLLPTGILPLTSVITKLTYGPTERLLVYHTYSNYSDEEAIAQLPDYVTEKGNPANTKKVANVVIELPVPFLQKGVEFVDTPGVGSTIESNTITTYDFLPSCDAVLFVTGADTPMTSIETSFLQEIAKYVNKLFFVINKIDLVNNREENELMEFVQRVIRNYIPTGKIKIFPVSSQNALKAKETSDTGLYAKSGLEILENTLATFLSEEKKITLLRLTTEKLLHILDVEKEQGTFEEKNLHLREEIIRKNPSGTVHKDTFKAASSLLQAREAIVTLLQKIAGNKITIAKMSPSQSKKTSTQEENYISSEEIPTAILNPKVDLETDLKTRSCPACNHLINVSWDYYTQFQYSLSSNEKTQNDFAAATGFCPLHTWQLMAVASPYGASLGYTRLAEKAAARIRAASLDNNIIGQLFKEVKNCRVCELLSHTEKTYIERLATELNNAENRDQYDHSEGLCLWHLNLLMDIINNPEIKQFLLLHTARHFEQDAEDMRTFALKRDALRRSLLNQNEKSAYYRTIIRMVGARKVCAPWDEGGEI